MGRLGSERILVAAAQGIDLTDFNKHLGRTVAPASQRKEPPVEPQADCNLLVWMKQGYGLDETSALMVAQYPWLFFYVDCARTAGVSIKISRSGGDPAFKLELSDAERSATNKGRAEIWVNQDPPAEVKRAPRCDEDVLMQVLERIRDIPLRMLHRELSMPEVPAPSLASKKPRRGRNPHRARKPEALAVAL